MKFIESLKCEKCGATMEVEQDHFACPEYMAGDDSHESYPVDRGAAKVIRVEGGAGTFDTLQDYHTWEGQA